ncbi:MAG: DUF5050 domain-containing protein [Lachnospiraceae bacterium]|nr:DUF5050 domain-containing protein [Lachnospiraceae bacterium]
MSKRGKRILTTIVILILLIGVAILSSISKRIPKNPDGTVGNTAGNLNNKGLFCETENKIYFANAYDNYKLYSMNMDNTEIKKIGDVSVHYLCNGGNYLYYYQSSSEGGSGLGYLRSITGLYRMDLKKHSVNGISRYGSGMLQLVNNELYYKRYKKEEGVCLYAMSTSGKEDSLILKEADAISPSCVWNNQIYFTYTSDKRGLYVLDPVTKAISLFVEGNIWFPQIVDGYVYYMDADKDYSLCRFSLSDSQAAPELLTSDRVDTFLVYENMIYYQKNDADAPALKRMSLDGSNAEIVADGTFENLNGAGGNVYFNSFGSPTPVYYTPVSGSLMVNEFEGAKEAAIENMKK